MPVDLRIMDFPKLPSKNTDFAQVVIDGWWGGGGHRQIDNLPKLGVLTIYLLSQN